MASIDTARAKSFIAHHLNGEGKPSEADSWRYLGARRRGRGRVEHAYANYTLGTARIHLERGLFVFDGFTPTPPTPLCYEGAAGARNILDQLETLRQEEELGHASVVDPLKEAFASAEYQRFKGVLPRLCRFHFEGHADEEICDAGRIDGPARGMHVAIADIDPDVDEPIDLALLLAPLLKKGGLSQDAEALFTVDDDNLESVRELAQRLRRMGFVYDPTDCAFAAAGADPLAPMGHEDDDDMAGARAIVDRFDHCLMPDDAEELPDAWDTFAEPLYKRYAPALPRLCTYAFTATADGTPFTRASLDESADGVSLELTQHDVGDAEYMPQILQSMLPAWLEVSSHEHVDVAAKSGHTVREVAQALQRMGFAHSRRSCAFGALGVDPASPSPFSHRGHDARAILSERRTDRAEPQPDAITPVPSEEARPEEPAEANPTPAGPPTPMQVEAWVRADDADAFARVLEADPTLLTRPRQRMPWLAMAYAARAKNVFRLMIEEGANPNVEAIDPVGRFSQRHLAVSVLMEQLKPKPSEGWSDFAGPLLACPRLGAGASPNDAFSDPDVGLLLAVYGRGGVSAAAAKAGAVVEASLAARRGSHVDAVWEAAARQATQGTLRTRYLARPMPDPAAAVLRQLAEGDGSFAAEIAAHTGLSAQDLTVDGRPWDEHVAHSKAAAEASLNGLQLYTGTMRKGQFHAQERRKTREEEAWSALLPLVAHFARQARKGPRP